MIAPRTRARPRAGLRWAIACLLILGLTMFLLSNWLRGGLPTSARREVLTELSITWMFRQELTQGQMLSEWNPTWFSGFPWLRYLSYPVYYAVAAASVWGGMTLERALVAFYFIVLAGSGLAMYGYLSRVLGDWRAALIGAVVYEAFPYHNHVGVETWIHAAFWMLLPLPLWMIELARAQGLRRTNYLLLAGVSLGAFPVVSSEYAMIAGPFVVLYLLWREASDVRRGRQSLTRAALSVILVGLVAIGMAAFFVLPAILEARYVGIHAKHGTGMNVTDEVLRQYSITPRVIWYAVAKRWHLAASDAGLPWIARSFWSVSWYPGLLAPALVLLGLVAVPRRAAAQAALVGAALSVLFVTGPTFPANFFVRLPVVGRLMPFRGLLLTVAFVSILTGHGAEWLLTRWKGGWLPWALTLAVLLGVMAEFLPSRLAYQTTKTYFSEPERQAYAWLAAQRQEGRLWEVSSNPQDDYLRSYSLAEVAMPRHLGYYDNGAPLHTWEQATWTDVRTVLRLHQVRYVLLRLGEQRATELTGLLGQAGYQVAFEAANVQVWENPLVGAYAQLYGTAALDATQDFRHSFAALPEFVWREIAMITPRAPYLDDERLLAPERYRYILVDQPVTRDPKALETLRRDLGKMVQSDEVAALDPARRPEATLYYERQGYGDIYVGVSSPKGGVLTIAESWYPHWQVSVDGQRQEALRVNWALLGAWVKPGEHRVEFHFERPWYVYLGYAATALTLLLLVLWWTWTLGEALKRPKAIPSASADGERPGPGAGPGRQDGRT